MSKIMRNPRAFVALVAVIATALLVACGGGGGSAPAVTPTPVVAPVTTPVVPPVTFTLNASGCTALDSQGSCNVPVTWASSGTTTPRLTVNGVSVSSLASGAQTVSISLGTTTIALTDNGTTLKSVPVVAACNAGSAGVAGICTLTVVRYTELKLVVFADQGGYVGKVTSTGVTRLTNNTGYNSGAAFPIFLCGIWDKLLANGMPYISCQTPAVGNVRRNFPVNPQTASIEAEWTGAVPVGAVLHDVPYGTFGATPYAAHGVSRTGMYIDSTDGVYYFTSTDSTKLLLTSNNFATSVTVATGDFKYLVMFSNP